LRIGLYHCHFLFKVGSTSADKVEPFFIEHQLDYAQVAMCEVVLMMKTWLWNFYAPQEAAKVFLRLPTNIQDKSLRRSGGYQGILHRTELKPEISVAVRNHSPDS